MKGKTLEAVVRKLRSVPAKEWSARARIKDEQLPGVTVLSTQLQSESVPYFKAYLYRDPYLGRDDSYRLLVQACSGDIVIDERSPSFGTLYSHTMAKVAAQYKTGLARCLSIQ